MESLAPRRIHVHETLELIVPFTLLAFSILAGIHRYFFVLRIRHYYRPLLAQGSQEELVWNPHKSKLTIAIQVLNYLVQISFLVDLGVVIVRALLDHVWTSAVIILYNIFSWIAFLANYGMMVVETKKGGKWAWPNYTFFWLALIGESLIGYHLYQTFDPDEDIYMLIMLGISAVRYLFLVILAIGSLAQLYRDPTENDLEALAALDAGSANHESYGTFGSTTNVASTSAHPPSSSTTAVPPSPQTAAKGKGKGPKTDIAADPFKDFGAKIRKIIPYIWPKAQPHLQWLIILSCMLLAIGRVVNFLVPWQTGVVIRGLTGTDGNPPVFDARPILLFIVLRFLQGSSGLVAAAQRWAWIPVEQSTTRGLTISVFEHVHNLSLHYHLNRKTGEVLSVIDRGTGAIASILGTFLFTGIPVMADITIAVIYFLGYWSWKYALIVFTTIALYIGCTVYITTWRTQQRRDLIQANNEARTKAVDSLLNFETVKYYSAEGYEVSRYTEAIDKYLTADFKTQTSLQILNLTQSFIMTAGQLAGCLLCAYEVSQGEKDVGDFMQYLAYIMQLYGPLNFLGTYYRMLQSNFIDMEKMMVLMEEEQVILDKPNAGLLTVSAGEIVFENVTFSYDDRQVALNNVSFTVPHGKTVALVGPSGSGKSTILRLLFRFYDVTSGRILIDGQDISNVTQHSLRTNIGVVPQDTVLFNDTILYNIGYGRIGAPREDIEQAARNAQIHDKIMTFPDQYETKVGERGLRLSGGEKQRVAIARTLLKNPPVVFLDEATSALDGNTEAHIQTALNDMTQNRTTLIIAHRLSTIVHADIILCVQDGQIVERGSHEELLALGLNNNGEGIYYQMWQRHIKEHHGEDNSTVDGQSSSDESGLKKQKIKAKAIRGPQQMREVTTTPESELTQVVVDKPSDASAVVADKPSYAAATAVPATSTPEPEDAVEVVVVQEELPAPSQGESDLTEDNTPSRSGSASPAPGPEGEGSASPKTPKTPLTASERASIRKKKSKRK